MNNDCEYCTHCINNKCSKNCNEPSEHRCLEYCQKPLQDIKENLKE